MNHRNKLLILALLAVIFCIGTAASAMVAEESIVGEVVNSAGGYAIATTNGTWYLVEGYDVSGLLGQTVKATGGISEEGGVKTISVTALEEM
jgi:hypothetical protein